MKSDLLAAALAVLIVAPSAASAADPTEALSQCLVENASPKDQAALMRWMFSAVAANPSLKTMATLSASDRESINKAMAATFERLMLQDCRKEVVLAAGQVGDQAIAKAFEVMGRRAAEQLLSDPAASAELERMTEYFDKEQWTALSKDVEAAGKKK